MLEEDSIQHNRVKDYLVPATKPFLLKLGITNSAGQVRYEMYDKFRQINKFVEILGSLIKQANLSLEEPLKIVDFGSGKNYLTFALHDYLLSQGAKQIQSIGVESRKHLVNQGNSLATEVGFERLTFVENSIADYTGESAQIVIALHACDTATDDAIVQGLNMQAKVLALAPCCHKYLRPKFKVPANLKPIFKHGILEERLAESVTDGLRALAIESHDYQCKVFEFVALEHTAKNLMLSATKTKRPKAINQQKVTELKELKSFFGIEDFYLDANLSKVSGAKVVL